MYYNQALCTAHDTWIVLVSLACSGEAVTPVVQIPEMKFTQPFLPIEEKEVIETRSCVILPDGFNFLFIIFYFAAGCSTQWVTRGPFLFHSLKSMIGCLKIAESSESGVWW